MATQNEICNKEFTLTFNIPPFLLPNLSGSLRDDLFHIDSVYSLDSGSDISIWVWNYDFTPSNLNEKTQTAWDFHSD